MIWTFTDAEKALVFEVAKARVAHDGGDFWRHVGLEAVAFATRRAIATAKSEPTAAEIEALPGFREPERSAAVWKARFQLADSTKRGRGWAHPAGPEKGAFTEMLSPFVPLAGDAEAPDAWLDLDVDVVGFQQTFDTTTEVRFAGPLTSGTLRARAPILR